MGPHSERRDTSQLTTLGAWRARGIAPYKTGGSGMMRTVSGAGREVVGLQRVRGQVVKFIVSLARRGGFVASNRFAR
jgi:hypothetical protein